MQYQLSKTLEVELPGRREMNPLLWTKCTKPERKKHMKRVWECFLLIHCYISFMTTLFFSLLLDWCCLLCGLFTKIWTTLEGGALRRFLGNLFETMLINNLRKLCFISNTLSARVQTMDRCCANVWQKYGLSLLLGVSVAFWYCKQLTRPRRSSVSEIVYTKEFHLSVCLQFTCEWAKPS